MGERLIETVDATSVASLLKEAGWPVSPSDNTDVPQIVSATDGVSFNICFGTKAAGAAGWTDFTMSAPFSIDQQISPVVGAFWNRRNRFARVYRTDKQIFLDMDIIVHGGVSHAYLRYQLAVWSDLVRLFLRHLRADQAVLARHAAVQGDAAVDSLAKTDGANNGRAPAPDTPLEPRSSRSSRTRQPAAPPARSQHKKGKTKQDAGPA